MKFLATVVVFALVASSMASYLSYGYPASYGGYYSYSPSYSKGYGGYSSLYGVGYGSGLGHYAVSTPVVSHAVSYPAVSHYGYGHGLGYGTSGLHYSGLGLSYGKYPYGAVASGKYYY